MSSSSINAVRYALQNEAPPINAWVDFELVGTRSNRSAIGAEVRLFWNGQEQLQQVSGGCGYSAQNQRRLHFGLGKNSRIDKESSGGPRGRTDNRIPRPWPRSQAGGTSMTTPTSTETTPEQEARPSRRAVAGVSTTGSSRRCSSRESCSSVSSRSASWKVTPDTAGDCEQHCDGAGFSTAHHR